MKEKELKNGDTVYFISINMPNKISAYDFEKEGIFIEMLNVVYITNRKIALSDDSITLLDLPINGKKESYNHYLDDISVYVKTNETFFANGIFARCYTTEKVDKSINKIKKEIIKNINLKYGFLFNGIESKLDNLKIENKI